MTPKQVIDYYGGELKAAVALRRSPPTIRNWIKHGIPWWSQMAIQAATQGALKAHFKPKAGK